VKPADLQDLRDLVVTVNHSIELRDSYAVPDGQFLGAGLIVHERVVPSLIMGEGIVGIALVNAQDSPLPQSMEVR
jgi:hypothetical protein